jgi:hypothetical protein
VRSSFAGFRFSPDVIVLAVCWYLRDGLGDIGHPVRLCLGPPRWVIGLVGTVGVGSLSRL